MGTVMYMDTEYRAMWPSLMAKAAPTFRPTLVGLAF